MWDWTAHSLAVSSDVEPRSHRNRPHLTLMSTDRAKELTRAARLAAAGPLGEAPTVEPSVIHRPVGIDDFAVLLTGRRCLHHWIKHVCHIHNLQHLPKHGMKPSLSIPPVRGGVDHHGLLEDGVHVVEIQLVTAQDGEHGLLRGI